jgi:hypothetical protein
VVVRGEAFGGGLFDGDLLAAECDLLAGGALRGEQAKAPDGDVALIEELEEFAADDAGAADNGDVPGVQGGAPWGVGVVYLW